MPKFKVTKIIDGDTFDVSPNWKWKENEGTRVRPTGYDAPELKTHTGQIAKNRLLNLILGKEVEFNVAHRIDRGRLVCDVYFMGNYLADYFPEY
jgi:endonuclease YncB( thermonuclease family)